MNIGAGPYLAGLSSYSVKTPRKTGPNRCPGRRRRISPSPLCSMISPAIQWPRRVTNRTFFFPAETQVKLRIGINTDSSVEIGVVTDRATGMETIPIGTRGVTVVWPKPTRDRKNSRIFFISFRNFANSSNSRFELEPNRAARISCFLTANILADYLIFVNGRGEICQPEAGPPWAETR